MGGVGSWWARQRGNLAVPQVFADSRVNARSHTMHALRRRLFYGTKLAMERKQPITHANDPHLLQLLKNGTFVYNWHEALAAGESAAAAAAKRGEDSGSDFTPGMRHGLSSQCQSDFQVRTNGRLQGRVPRFPKLQTRKERERRVLRVWSYPVHSS